MRDSECVFCDIVTGEADALVVEERESTLAFSPLDPVAPGHVLVIPKAHHETLFDVPEGALADVMAHVRALAGELRADDDGGRGFDGVNVLHDSTAYQSVPHLHMHVVGRRDGDRDLWPESDYDGTKRDAYDTVTTALDE